MSDTPEIAAAKRKLEDQATELPNWARQLLDYIASMEDHVTRLIRDLDAQRERSRGLEQELERVTAEEAVFCGEALKWLTERELARGDTEK